jgi:hypothetical protein
VVAWAAAALVGARLVVAFVKLGRLRAPEFRAAWEAFAEGRGVLTDAQGGLQVAFQRELAHVTATVGPDHATYLPRTLVHAPYVLGAGPAFEVADPVLISGRMPLEWRELTLDDPRFDDRFLSRSNDAETVRRAFDARARELVAALPRVRVGADEHGVLLYLPGVVVDHAALNAAVDLVEHLASVDAAAAFATLRALPGATVYDATGEAPAEQKPIWAHFAEQGVQLRYAAQRGRRTTVASVDLAGAQPAGWFVVDAAGEPDAVTESSLLPPALLPLLPAVGASVLRFREGRAWLSMDGVVTDPTRLLAAVAVCHALATSVAGGAYR